MPRLSYKSAVQACKESEEKRSDYGEDQFVPSRMTRSSCLALPPLCFFSPFFQLVFPFFVVFPFFSLFFFSLFFLFFFLVSYFTRFRTALLTSSVLPPSFFDPGIVARYEGGQARFAEKYRKRPESTET